MKKQLTLVLFVLYSLNIIIAQTISGTVNDESDSPLEFVNVILESNKGKIISHTYTDINGTYEFTNVENGNYVLKSTSLGFDTYQDTIQFEKSIVRDIMMKSSSVVINEVTVKAKRPQIIQRGGTTIVNLENAVLTGQNLSDVLRKVPGLIVNRDQVRVGVSQNATIMINGQSTNYMDMATLLQDFPVENIKRIEVIKQADASFEASGTGPILNIILHRNKIQGTNGSISASIGEDNGLEYTSNLYLYSFQNSLNIEGSVGYTNYSFLENLNIYRNIGSQSINQENIQPMDPESVGGNLGLDYYLNDFHRFGVSVRARKRENVYTALNNLSFRNSIDNSNHSLNTDRNTDEGYVFYRINPYYEWSFDKENENYLRLNTRFLKYNTNQDYHFINSASSTIQDYANQLTLQDGDTRLWSVSLDYVNLLSDEGTNSNQLKLGGRLDRTMRDSRIEVQEENENNQLVPVENQTDNFLIDEYIYALYGQFSHNTEMFNLSAGLRWELSNTDGTSMVLNTTNTRKISQLFPNVTATYKLNKQISVNADYAYRINRPSYGSLNPFSINYDPLTQDSGNPVLQPEFAHKYGFRLLFENQPALEITFTDVKDNIFQAIFQDDISGDIQRQYINIDKNQSLNFQLGIPLFFIPGVQGGGYFTVTHQDIVSRSENYAYDQSAWNWSIATQLTIDLPGDIEFSNYFYYGSGALDGALNLKWFTNAGLGLSRSFLDNKLKVSFNWNNFIQRRNTLVLADDNIDGTVESFNSFGYYKLGVKYNFGQKSFKKKKKSGFEDSGLERIQ